MDRQQFDALSRRFAHLVGRRSVLHVAAFGPMAAGLAVAGDGDAKRKRKKKKCKPPRIKCGKKCLAAGACCTNADCTAVIGQVCVGNACECPSGQVAAGNRCAVPCSPACGDCQRCDDGVCGDVADDTPCANGGTCQAGVCKPDRSFGCTPSQNVCGGTNVACPDSTTSGAACFVDGDGDSVCGTAECTTVTTDTACESLLGSGAFVLLCPICSVGGGGKTHMCVLPVSA
ncbi:MAG: hypothetical protein U0Z70_20325 [Thermomicrobiales bacterium]